MLLPRGRLLLPLGFPPPPGQPIHPHGPLHLLHRGRPTPLPGLNHRLGIRRHGRPHRVHGHPLLQIQLRGRPLRQTQPHGPDLPRGPLLPRGRPPPLQLPQTLKTHNKFATMHRLLAGLVSWTLLRV